MIYLFISYPHNLFKANWGCHFRKFILICYFVVYTWKSWWWKLLNVETFVENNCMFDTIKEKSSPFLVAVSQNKVTKYH